MNELRFTDTNAADDSAGRVFGLDGNLYLPVVFGLVVGVVLFAGLGFAGTGYPLAGTVAAIPAFGPAVWVLGFRQGKPAGYDRDKVDDLLGGADFTREAEAISHTKAHSAAPDGRLVEGMLVFGSPERGGAVAKGFRLEPPDLRGASFERLNAFQDQVRALLALVSPGRRLQIQWWPDSDYRQALLAYHARTQEVTDPTIRAVRNERFTRYWPRTLNGSLRREHLAIFLSIEIDFYAGNVCSKEGLRDHYAAVLQELAGQFEEFAGTLRTVFGPETPVHPMDDAEHCACLRRFLNPSHARRTEETPAGLFDPTLTMQENCWHSDGVGQRGGGFSLDGHYHAVLALSRWPQRTRPGIVTHLTGLPFLDYAITVNVTPVASGREIQREEKATERLRGEYAEKPRASLLVALRKKERKVEALAGGFARPFHVIYLMRVWAPTPEALREKVAAVQAAVNGMDGAQSFECALPTTAKKLFFSSWPGWTHSSYHHRELYAEDTYLADLLPFSATFVGALDHAEALYDGGHGNLVGVSAAVGGSPQHAVLIGMTGAGKSAFIEDLLFQTADHFSHSLLIEEGFSYKRFTEAMGETPIRAFTRYVIGLAEPGAFPAGPRLLAIPIKRSTRPLLGYLARDEVEAVLGAADFTTWAGRRDHLLLALLYNTGARISEALAVRAHDVQDRVVRLHGKGRKERTVPIWARTATEIKRWRRENQIQDGQHLFLNSRGAVLTRQGARLRLRLALRKAAETNPKLKGRKIGLHSLRHSCAMHLLQAGVALEVIALWLGHESLMTTHGYVSADLKMKEATLSRLDSLPAARVPRRDPASRLLAFLEAI